MAMDPLSWEGRYRSDESAEWAEATLWIDDGHIGIGLTRTWTLERPIPLVDVAAVRAVGRGDDGRTSIEVTLLSGRIASMTAPKPFVDLLVEALEDGSAVDVTRRPTAGVAPSPPHAGPVRVPPAGGFACAACGAGFTTFDALRTHASEHLPVVEFVPLPGT